MAGKYTPETEKRRREERKVERRKKLCSRFPFAYCHYPERLITQKVEDLTCTQCGYTYGHAFQSVRPHANVKQHILGDPCE